MKIKTHIYIVFFSLFLICFFSNCKPEKLDDKNTTPIYINEEIKKYVDFKPGTYWIYEDSASGVLDTVEVYFQITNRLDTVKDNSGKITGIYEWLKVFTSSSYYNADFYYDIHTSFSQHGDLVFRTIAIPQQIVAKTICLFNPFEIDNKKGEHDDVISITSISDSTIINQKKYFSVIGLSHSKDITENKNAHITYYAKNIGVIKKEIKGDKTWKLKSYKIY